MEDPVLPSEDELPSWVFEAIKPDKSLQQLEEEIAKNGLDSLTPYEQKRLKKLRRRQKIKDNNYARVIGVVLSK